MAEVKLVVIYPRPKNVDVFEKVYQEEHERVLGFQLPAWSVSRGA